MASVGSGAGVGSGFAQFLEYQWNQPLADLECDALCWPLLAIAAEEPDPIASISPKAHKKRNQRFLGVLGGLILV